MCDRQESFILVIRWGNLKPGNSAGRLQSDFCHVVWNRDDAQGIAEYAVMLTVILVIAVGTVRLIGANASSIFSSVGSAIQ